MHIVEPILVDDSNLQSSNVVENDYAVYNAATTYNAGDRVMLLSNHHNYECVAANTLGISPEADAIKWLDLGFNNRFAMFDTTISTVTSNAGSIDVSINIARLVGTVSLHNMSGDSVQIILTDAVEGIVYDKTMSLTVASSTDWYSYFFGEDEQLNSVLKMDLPPYLNATLQIIITGATATCGLCVIGNQKFIGNSQYGLGLNINDYSKKTKDSFGNATFVERDYSNNGNFDIRIPTSRVEQIRDLLATYRATPVLYIGTENMPETAIFGVFKNFNIILSNAIYARCSLTVEGLV